MQDAKAQWLQDSKNEHSELQAALNKAEERLSEMMHKLEELQRSKEDEIKHLEWDLNQAWSDRDSAAREWSSESSKRNSYCLYIYICSYIKVHTV